MLDFGACIVGGNSRYLLVFENGDYLDKFVDSQLWVDLERVFAPVKDGQTLSGAAGENWLITGFDPRARLFACDGRRGGRKPTRPRQFTGGLTSCQPRSRDPVRFRK